MSLPDDALSSQPVLAPYSNKHRIFGNKLIDYEMGGKDIQDPSEGLLYQEWKCSVKEVIIQEPDIPGYFSLTSNVQGDIVDDSGTLWEWTTDISPSGQIPMPTTWDGVAYTSSELIDNITSINDVLLTDSTLVSGDIVGVALYDAGGVLVKKLVGEYIEEPIYLGFTDAEPGVLSYRLTLNDAYTDLNSPFNVSPSYFIPSEVIGEFMVYPPEVGQPTIYFGDIYVIAGINSGKAIQCTTYEVKYSLEKPPVISTQALPETFDSIMYVPENRELYLTPDYNGNSVEIGIVDDTTGLFSGTFSGVPPNQPHSLAYDNTNNILYSGLYLNWGIAWYDPSTKAMVGTSRNADANDCMVYCPSNNLIYTGRVSGFSIYDPAADSTVDFINLSNGSASDITYCPSNDSIYVCVDFDDTYVFDTSVPANEIARIPSSQYSFQYIVYSSLNDLLYIFDNNPKRIDIVDPSTNSIIETVALTGLNTYAFPVDPIYCSSRNSLFFSELNGDGVWEYDLTNKKQTKLDTGEVEIDGIAFSDDTNSLYGLSNNGQTLTTIKFN